MNTFRLCVSAAARTMRGPGDRGGDVVDGGAPLVFLVHAGQADKIFLRVAGHLRTTGEHSV